jgi:hypothetical protein
MLIDGGFDRHLGAHSTDGLDAEGGSVVGLWPDGRIGLLNRAWQSFAIENGGALTLERWPLGSDMASGISGVLRAYYERAFDRVRLRGEPWEQTYQCNAPSRYREFRLRVLPLERRALLLVHSLAVDAVYPEEIELEQPLSEYQRDDGLVRQCSNCRRTQRAGSPGVWDWVRAYVSQPPPNATHGICETCVRQHYPEL